MSKIADIVPDKLFRVAMAAEAKTRKLVAVVIPEIDPKSDTWEGKVIYMLAGQFVKKPDAGPGWAAVLRKAADIIEIDEAGDSEDDEDG